MDPLAKRQLPEANCALVNFGDNLRIILDIDQRPVRVQPGEVKRACLPDVTIRFIRKAMATDPLCVFETSTELDNQTKECLSILSKITTEDYDSILTRTIALVGAEAVGQQRPTRGQLSLLLKDVAFKAQKVVIKEQVPSKDDPRRTPTPANKPTEQRPPAPDRTKDDNSDGVLKDVIAPVPCLIDGLPGLKSVDGKFSIDEGKTWHDNEAAVTAFLAEAAKKPLTNKPPAEEKPHARSSDKTVSKTRKKKRVKIEA